MPMGESRRKKVRLMKDERSTESKSAALSPARGIGPLERLSRRSTSKLKAGSAESQTTPLTGTHVQNGYSCTTKTVHSTLALPSTQKFLSLT